MRRAYPRLRPRLSPASAAYWDAHVASFGGFAYAGSAGFVELSMRGKPAHVHRNCARFSPLVKEASTGAFSGVKAEVARGARLVSPGFYRGVGVGGGQASS